MSAVKREFKWFTIVDYEKEGEYLRRMHKAGWSLTKAILPGLYFFESCEPEDVVYQLDYNSEGLLHKSEYVQMFQDCGWEYVLDYVGYSYFRKPASAMQGEEAIFCDDDSRLEMMKRIFRGRLVPLLIAFCCLIIPQLIIQMQQEDPFHSPLFWVFVTLLVLYGTIFIQFAVLYHRFKINLKKL